MDSHASWTLALCSRTVASLLPSAASGGTGPSLCRPYLVWGQGGGASVLGCVSLAPLHLADQGGLKTQPDSAMDLLGEATPCHLWVSGSSAERQIKCCWAASGEKGQVDVSLGHRRAGAKALKSPQPRFSTRAECVLGARGWWS